MSASPDCTQAFLGGLPIPVDPTVIEQTLATLWKPAAESRGPGVAHPAVTRVSLGTLVAVAPLARANELETACRAVALEHPTRMVVVLLDPGVAKVEATVAATCDLPAPGRPQVCSETIVLRVPPDQLERLPGAILPLLLPDVPATLWWAAPHVPPAVVADQLASVLDRCVVDLTDQAQPRATWRALAGAAPQLTDLAWWRARAWREATAQLFDGALAQAALAGIDRVEVVSTASRHEELLPAALLAGWVAGQLGWRPLSRIDDRHTCWERLDDSEASIHLTPVLAGDARPGRLQALTLQSSEPAGTWCVERRHDRPRELCVTAHSAQWCALPFSLPAPRPEPERLLHAVLDTPADNPTRTRALEHAAWMLDWLRPA